MQTQNRQLVVQLRRRFPAPVFDITRMANEDRDQEFKRAAKAREAATNALLEHAAVCRENRYDFEYLTAAEIEQLWPNGSVFTGSHYWHWSPVMELVLDAGVPKGRMLEAGCGSGLLLKQLIKMGADRCNLVGCDLSLSAGRRVRELGIEFRHGPVQTAEGRFTFIVHSYFIDRDQDQAGTLHDMCKKLEHRGVLALEGWFPCGMADTHGIEYGKANLTRGDTAEDDIARVVAFVQKQGLCLESILIGTRFVYSLDGPEALPSHILVFRNGRPLPVWRPDPDVWRPH